MKVSQSETDGQTEKPSLDSLNEFEKIKELANIYDPAVQKLILPALSDLWQHGLAGQTLEAVREKLKQVSTDIIDFANFKYGSMINKKQIKNRIGYYKTCLYNAIDEADMDEAFM